jgi:hypothetical protein
MIAGARTGSRMRTRGARLKEGARRALPSFIVALMKELLLRSLLQFGVTLLLTSGLLWLFRFLTFVAHRWNAGVDCRPAGYLWKKSSDSNSWSKRWFVLNGKIGRVRRRQAARILSLKDAALPLACWSKA